MAETLTQRVERLETVPRRLHDAAVHLERIRRRLTVLEQDQAERLEFWADFRGWACCIAAALALLGLGLLVGTAL